MNVAVDAEASVCEVQQEVAVLATKGLGKRYGAHQALHPVDISLMPGRVHVLFGENGAGKSTLITMLAGANTPTEGSLEVEGRPVVFQSVAQARAHGVRAVFQEFSLIPHLSVADNIVLGEEPLGQLGLLDKQAILERAQALIAAVGFDLRAQARVESLSRGQQQMAEICKALLHAPRVLILDEPTASLTEHDTQALFALIRKLKAQGTAIVYITHRMHEIPEIGDEVSVLRDGRYIATVPASTPEDELITLMTGRQVADIYPPVNTELGEVRLALSHLRTSDGSVQDFSLELRAGEILGLAGLVGCGKSEVGQSCFGLLRLVQGGMRLNGQETRFRHPAEAIAKGLWYCPSDRKRDGLALMRPASDNMSLSSLSFGRVRGWLRRNEPESALLGELAGRVEFPARRLSERVENFSGGNQQKVLLAKGLAQDISVYIFDEPTVGVDVGARQAIYKYLGQLSAQGAAVLLISSDLPELLGLSHRLIVMREGRNVAEFARDEFEQHAILEQFFD